MERHSKNCALIENHEGECKSGWDIFGSLVTFLFYYCIAFTAMMVLVHWIFPALEICSK